MALLWESGPDFSGALNFRRVARMAPNYQPGSCHRFTVGFYKTGFRMMFFSFFLNNMEGL